MQRGRVNVVLDLRGESCDTILVERPLDPSSVLVRAMVHKVVVLCRSHFERSCNRRRFVVLASVVIELGGDAHFAVGCQVRLATVNPPARCTTHLVMHFIHTHLFIHIGIFRDKVDPIALDLQIRRCHAWRRAKKVTAAVHQLLRAGVFHDGGLGDQILFLRVLSHAHCNLA